ncbi:enoyl-CoA hydratase [Amylocarpus encephaloides]|uniref:Enoyl-CoA hydratase n=1 Tax=Amylocarpus encephaloides TaxID=45428 RepID=A0A9P7YC54_9HELO|nr:enoyl-CoA hydratase [Amylocarpus encephaloides]
MQLHRISLLSFEPSLVRVEVDAAGIALVKINRPEKRNALSQKLIDTLIDAMAMVERDVKVRVVVLTGSRTTGPFSAGADLGELLHISTTQAYATQYLADLNKSIISMRKPIICAVAGFALGGGFELAMMCDIIYAASDAKFGLPELTVGTIPGAGGTQRLTRVVGKQKAMDMILTSKTMTGSELEAIGLVARSFPLDEVLEEAMKSAGLIALRSVPVVGLAKEAILSAEQTTLDAGLKLERSLYYGSFALEDRTEGMAAFVEKRRPVFKDC